jgi:hypothetical protein
MLNIEKKVQECDARKATSMSYRPAHKKIHANCRAGRYENWEADANIILALARLQFNLLHYRG